MDCETCSRILAKVLREDRPRMLLDAIQHGVFTDRGVSGEGVEEGGAGGGSTRSLAAGAAASGGDEASEQGRKRLAKLECRICPDTGAASGARAYLEAPPPAVVLCANRLGTHQEIEEAVVHELTHAYDYLVSGMNLLDCRALAYSEVRAAHAAECSELRRAFVCSYFEKGCVRTMATKSTENLFPGIGAACVNEVFNDAYHDRRPLAVVAKKGGDTTTQHASPISDTGSESSVR